MQVKTGDLTNTWLPWLDRRAGSDREWAPPTVDEQMVLFRPSGQLANGVVLTGLFSDHIPGLHRRTYADGAVIEYDSVDHHLNATLPDSGTTSLVSKGGVNIIGPISHQGDYNQTGNQNVVGLVTVSKDVIAANISLVKNLHGGVLVGSAKTGKPE